MAEPLIRDVQPAAWRALIASYIGWMFDGFENGALVLVAPAAARELVAAEELSRLPVHIGSLLTASLLGWATGGILAGILADYIGRKRMMMISIFLYASLTALSALAPSFTALLVLRFLTGLGLGAEWAPGAALVSESWPPATRGRAGAFLHSAFGVGFIVASSVWYFLSQHGPTAWRWMFVVGVLPAFAILWIRSGVSDAAMWVSTDERRRSARSRASRGEAVDPGDRELLRFTMAHVLATPALRRRIAWLVAMAFVSTAGWWATTTWIPQHMGDVMRHLGRSDAPHWSALAAMIYTLGGTLGLVAFGFLADVLGRKWTIWLYYAGSLPSILIFFRWVEDPHALLVAAAVDGFFVMGQFSFLTVYLPELFPTAVRGSAISLVFDISRYAAAVTPFLAGRLITSLGDMSTAASLIGLVFILGLIATPFAGPETKGQPLPA